MVTIEVEAGFKIEAKSNVSNAMKIKPNEK
jgi:hypothetical protein